MDKTDEAASGLLHAVTNLSQEQYDALVRDAMLWRASLSATPANDRAVAAAKRIMCSTQLANAEDVLLCAQAILALPATQRSETAEKALDTLAEVHRNWCNYCKGDAIVCLNAPAGGCSLRDYMISEESK